MNNRLIYDIGMHRGDDTNYYLKLGYNVIAVDANPFLVENCKEKFKNYIQDEYLSIINKGISSINGKSKFYINTKNSEWSSINKEIGTRNCNIINEIDIETITLEDIFKEYGIPFYLKIDIEGSDKFCLESIDIKNKPQYVSCEATQLELIDILCSKGYSKFKMINQTNGFKPFCYVCEISYLPSLIQKVIWKIKKYIFKKYLNYGDTGPFGESTKGKWKTSTEIKQDFNSFYKKDGQAINSLSWFDFHATY